MAGNRVTDNVGGNLSIETKQERNTYEEKNTSARISMNYGIKEGKTSLAVELVEAIPRATTKVPKTKPVSALEKKELTRISDTAELHHLLEQKMRKKQ